MSSYTVRDGAVISKKGLPSESQWFCDGRLAFSYNGSEITKLDYFGEKTLGNAAVFLKRFWGGMKFYLSESGKRTLLRAENCTLWPFGFTSKGEKCRFSLYAAKDFLFFVCNASDTHDISLEFYSDFLFSPTEDKNPDLRCISSAKRSWNDTVFKDNKLFLTYNEDNNSETKITISSSCPVVYRKTSENGKSVISAKNIEPGKECAFAIHFTNGERMEFGDYNALFKIQCDRYKNIYKRAPKLKSGHPLLDKYFSLLPLYHESLKIPEIPGAIRAQSTHYWVWGWDCMTSADPYIYWGDFEFVGQMLDLMNRYFDPKSGIPHGFTRDMKPFCDAEPPAQGLYITLLDLYRISGGDIKPYFNCAKTIFERILKSEVNGSGLCKGISLYPDYRNLIRENGNDISTFNNTIAYCCAKSFEKIAEEYGDLISAKKAADFASRLHKNFDSVLFNGKYSFYDSSADAETFIQRGVPSNNAVKWENNYCGELVEPRMKECLEFYLKNLVCEQGLRPIPEWCDCFDSDANQLSCWWPVMCEFYARLINRLDRPDLTEKFVKWIEYWAARLMCPEGIPCYEDNENVIPDNWNCAPGIWHAYSMRGFYNVIVHSFAGVDFDGDGIRFYPYSGEEIDLINMNFGKKTVDIHFRGSGKNIDSVTVDGKNMGSPSIIPISCLKEHSDITVMRKK